MDDLNSRMEGTKGKNSETKERTIEIAQSEQERNNLEKIKESQISNTHIIRVSEERIKRAR